MRSLFALVLLLASCVAPHDWPMFGRDATRNAVSPEKNPPTDWSTKAGGERNVDWIAKLGHSTIGSPVIADGLVWIGSDNHFRRDPAIIGQASVLMCFRERDGEFLWQHARRWDPRLHGQGDWGPTPLRCTPLVEGDRLWYVDNEWQVVCLDIGPLKRSVGVPIELWKTDLIEKAGVSPLVLGMGWQVALSISTPYRGMIYVSTCNGLDWKLQKPGRPEAPAMVCIDAASGEILGREQAGISARTRMANWSSPVIVESTDQTRVLFGGGDGFLYAFDPVPVKDPGRSGPGTLRELWRFDCRRKDQENSSIAATPVVYEGKIYVVLGEDPETSGLGMLHCVDLVTGRSIWRGEEVEATFSTPIVHEGQVIVPTALGIIRAFDAATGRKLWQYDCLSLILASPMIADGRLFLSNFDGEMMIFDLRGSPTRPPVLKREIGCGTSTPVFVNDRLYIGGRHLYALREREGGRPAADSPAAKHGRAPGAMYLPTPPDIVEAMLLMAKVAEADLVYDLGSGDGRIVLAAAKKFKCRAIGVEIDPVLVEESRNLIREGKCEDRARIVHEDMLKANFSEATVVTLYVGERLNRLLIPKLQALKPGTRIVTHRFPLPGMKPVDVSKPNAVEDGLDHEVFLYSIPLQAEPGNK